MWLFQRKHISDPILYVCREQLMHRKDYLIKRAFVEFITPMGEAQIGINPRFNEQDEDEFRLQDVLLCVLLQFRNVCIVVVSHPRPKYHAKYWCTRFLVWHSSMSGPSWVFLFRRLSIVNTRAISAIFRTSL